MVRPYLFPSQKSSAEGRRRSARMAAPGSLGLLQVPPFTAAKCQSVPNRSAARRAPRALFGIRASAADAATKDAVLKALDASSVNATFRLQSLQGFKISTGAVLRLLPQLQIRKAGVAVLVPWKKCKLNY